MSIILSIMSYFFEHCSSIIGKKLSIIGWGLEKNKNQGHHPWGNSEEQIMKVVILGQDAKGSMMGTVLI